MQLVVLDFHQVARRGTHLELLTPLLGSSLTIITIIIAYDGYNILHMFDIVHIVLLCVSFLAPLILSCSPSGMLDLVLVLACK